MAGAAGRTLHVIMYTDLPGDGVTGARIIEVTWFVRLVSLQGNSRNSRTIPKSVFLTANADRRAVSFTFAE